RPSRRRDSALAARKASAARAREALAMIECALTLAGVLLPSLLIALAVRRWLERVPWRIVCLLLALAILFVARGVFTPDMPVPLDEVVRGYPYRGIFGDVQSKNSLPN